MSTTQDVELDRRFAQVSEVFRRSWSMYEKVVSGNGMRHREMEQRLHAVLADIKRPFSLMDMGCGDSSMACRALVGTQINNYTGVELVEELRILAERNLSSVVPRWTFLTANLIDAARRSEAGSFDIVLGSYSVHHLSLAEKGELLRNIYPLLVPGGTFILIDLMLRPGEDRQQYLARFHASAPRLLGMLTAEEREQVRQHMDSSDFPETLKTYEQLAQLAGFRQPVLDYRDPDEFYAMVRFHPAGA